MFSGMSFRGGGHQETRERERKRKDKRIKNQKLILKPKAPKKPKNQKKKPKTFHLINQSPKPPPPPWRERTISSPPPPRNTKMWKEEIPLSPIPTFPSFALQKNYPPSKKPKSIFLTFVFFPPFVFEISDCLLFFFPKPSLLSSLSSLSLSLSILISFF